jgi:4-amino-4-deoxy-L-arabinose transferase
MSAGKRRRWRTEAEAAMVATPGAASSTDPDVRRGAFALVVLYALLYLLPIGVRPLSSPDEVRYGEIAREMIASGDWVSPHLNGVRYFEKPALGHWLNAVSLRVFGENAFALRLPAALATGLAALIVFLLARRFVGRSEATLATAIFLTTFLVAGVGTFALLDAFLALFLTAALAAYYAGLRDGRPATRRAWLCACGAACGAAFLVKGFLALAIPVIVAVPYLAWGRRWRTVLTSPWWPIVVAAVVALPWSVLVHLREPDFWRYFFWVEHVQRFTAEDAQHAAPFWYYLAWLPLTGWPWIVTLPAAAIGLKRGAIDRDFVGYLVAWAALPLLFFSLSKGKLATYILPCFAPLSILLAVGLTQYFAAGLARAWRIAAAVIALAFATVVALVALAQSGALGDVPYAAGEGARLGVLLASLAAGMLGGLVALASRQARRRLAAVTVAGAMLLVPLHLALPRRALDNFAPGGIVARYAEATPDTILVSDAPLFGTVAWVLQRDDVNMLSPGEIDYGLSYPEARHRLLDAAGFAALLDASRGRRDVLVICEASTEATLKPWLPSSAQRSQHGKVIFWRVPA